MWRTLPAAARIYILALIAAGSLTIAHSIYSLFARPIGPGWFILAVLTLVSGSATLKLPALPATISVSETFVFTSVLLFGPAAGTLIVALDALVISLWSLRHQNPLYKIFFNVFALPVAIWVGSQIFFLMAGIQPLVRHSETQPIGAVLLPLLCFTLSYFLLNSSIIAVAIALERGVSAFRIWRENFAWISLNYFGGASVAALLVSYTRNLEFSQLAIIVPLLLVSYLTFATAMGRAEDTNRHLVQLNQLYMSTIETLAMAIDAKDQITHGHIRRVQMYAIGLARELGVSDETQIKAIEAAALLHDMGKLAVPDYILNKPGPLSTAEFSRMKRHASIGAEILSSIEFPYPVVPIVRHHHENWDGSGYPDGLKGTEIPIGARVLSVVDCFDALTSDRPYRRRLTDDEALRTLRERRGVMYDPLIIDTFITAYPKLAATVRAEEEAAKHLFFEIAQSAVPSPSSSIAQPTYDRGSVSSAVITIDQLLRSARDVTGLDDLVFYEYSKLGGDLIVVSAIGERSHLFLKEKLAIGERVTGWVAANRTAVVNSDSRLELESTEQSVASTKCTALPILNGDELLGVLTAFAPPGVRFADQDVSRLEGIAAALADIFSRSENPSDGIHGLAELIRRIPMSETTPISVIAVDIDASGSESSTQILTALRTHLRAGDVLFEQSRTRFVIILSATPQAGAQAMAQRMASEIRPLHRILVRIGVATATGTTDDVRALVHRAFSDLRHISPATSLG